MIKTRCSLKAFIDEQGVPMTRARHEAETGITAYGFVDSSKPTPELTRLLKSGQRTMLLPQGSPTPSIRVTEGVNPEDFSYDPELYKIATDAVNCGRITHTLEVIAKRGNEISNPSVAQYLGDVVSRSAICAQKEGSRLYGGPDGKTCSRIVYEQDREYWDIE